MVSGNALKFKSVTKSNRCRVCDGFQRCSYTDDGLLICRVKSGEQAGFVCLKESPKEPGAWRYRCADDPKVKEREEAWKAKNAKSQSNGHIDWAALNADCRRALTPALRDELAHVLGVPAGVLEFLCVGWHGDAWTFPGVDADGRIVGIALRDREGKKYQITGGHLGLFLPIGWYGRSVPLFLPEGASNTLAMSAAGLSAIGRPNNQAGVELMAKMLKDFPLEQEIIVVGDKDAKDDGKWPGLTGCMSFAAQLKQMLGRPVFWVLPGEGFKDLRARINSLGLPMDCADRWKEAGKTIIEDLVRRRKEAETVPAQPAPPLPKEIPWPSPLGEEAYHGLAGEAVRVLEPASEADPSGLLLQILVLFGNVIGRGPYFLAEADRHYTNEYLVQIGRTSKGRKGTSWGQSQRPLEGVDMEWATHRIQSGLSSGEGLIWAVRDPIVKREKFKEKGVVRYEDVEADPGISDKRLMVFEPEFANVLKQPERTGNILSTVLRQAWDGTTLNTMVKNDPGKATGAHISMVGHITLEELTRYLSETEMANGWGNRFLWNCVERSKSLPEGGVIDTEALDNVRKQMAEAVSFARGVTEVRRNEECRTLWRAIYEDLADGKPGLVGAMTGRGEAHVMRLAMLYALLDQSIEITTTHLQAGLECWRRVEQSVKYIFGDSLGDPLADELLSLLRGNPAGLTRNELLNCLSRHKSSERMGRALGLLLKHKLARCVTEQTGGRPAERWLAGG